MKQIKTLVLMQLRDKMNLSWVKSTKDIIHVVFSTLIKFAIITAAFTGILYGLTMLGLVYYSDLPSIMTFILTFVFLLLVISCTTGLTKALYFSEDNKVLITLPVTNNKIFISKLLVFLFYELKRSFTFTIPIVLGCVINVYMKGAVSGFVFLWAILPIILFVTLPVLIGGLLSIPTMYIYVFAKKYKLVKAIFIICGLAIYVLLILGITKFLPTEINMNQQWPELRLSVVKFLEGFEKFNPIGTQITRTMIGEADSFNYFKINWLTVAKFAIMLASCAVLYLGCYFISRPLFYKMMSKNFEFNKDNKKAHSNHKHSKVVSFNIKELKINIRDLNVSLNFALVYVTIPILIFILDKLFIAMNKSPIGVYSSYAFNVLLIAFPLLMSNAMISTFYSKEGRAGYIKKTKPVNPLIPLTAKLTFNLVMCIPSIIASCLVFNSYMNVCTATDLEEYVYVSKYALVLLILAMILLNYAHIFMCATNDILNPLNEQYATTGGDFSNVNEMRSNGSAILISIIYGFYSFILFYECVGYKEKFDSVFIRLFVISLLLATYMIIKYVACVKTIYAPSKE